MFRNTVKIDSLRIVFGFLGLSSIALEIITLANEKVLNLTNFLSFFTILSNLAAASMLIYLGIKQDESRGTQLLRGAVTLYMIMTGVIFALLLSGLEGVRLTAVPWDNIVLHYIMPVVLLADWLYMPPKLSFTYKSVAVWLVFPVVYVVYTLARGSIVGWYPYPFLNPAESSYTQVMLLSLALAFFVALGALGLKRYADYRLKQK